MIVFQVIISKLNILGPAKWKMGTRFSFWDCARFQVENEQAEQLGAQVKSQLSIFIIYSKEDNFRQV